MQDNSQQQICQHRTELNRTNNNINYIWNIKSQHTHHKNHILYDDDGGMPVSVKALNMAYSFLTIFCYSSSFFAAKLLLNQLHTPTHTHTHTYAHTHTHNKLYKLSQKTFRKEKLRYLIFYILYLVVDSVMVDPQFDERFISKCAKSAMIMCPSFRKWATTRNSIWISYANKPKDWLTGWASCPLAGHTD